LTPLLARQLAHKLSQQHPGLSKDEIAAKMRADLGHAPSADESRFIDAVVSRLQQNPQIESAQKTPVSAWVLIAANLVPLFGVLFFGWPLVALLALFWMENVVIGVLNVARMLLADPRDAALWAGKAFLVPFFCFHYGMFTMVHGVFVFSIFGGKKYDVQGFDLLDTAARAIADFGLWLPVAVLVASHLFSYLWNYLYRGEYRRAQLYVLMFSPYVRVMLLHVTLLVGGFLAQLLGSPVWALVLLLGLKTGLDLLAHVKEHSAKKR
jgi:hypothetical protein